MFVTDDRKCIAKKEGISVKRIVCATLVALFVSEPAQARLSIPSIKNHREPDLVVVTGDGRLPREASAPLEVQFQAYRRNFYLELAPSRIVDADSKTYIVDDNGYREIATVNYSYTGKVVGQEDSQVRVTLIDGSLTGVIQMGSTLYGIEPRSKYDPDASEGSIIVYRASENPFTGRLDVEPEEDATAATPDVLGMLQTGTPEGVSAFTPEGISGSWILSDGELRRHSIGLIGDYQFYQKRNRRCSTNTSLSCEALTDCARCSGNTSIVCATNTDCTGAGSCTLYGTCSPNQTAALADMDAAVNQADMAFRDSVPVGLRVSAKVLFTTTASQTGAQLASCPLLCLSNSATPSPGNVCASNTDCAAGSDCRLTDPIKFCTNAGSSYLKVCANNADCGASGNCNGAKTCTNSGRGGDPCVVNSDCGTGGNCSGGSYGTRICDGGTSDGKLCQLSRQGCSTYGNCCSAGDDQCVVPGARTRRAAGRYRLAAKACVGGTKDGYICTTNSDCTSPGTCTGAPAINIKNSGAVHLFTGCSIFVGGAGSAPLCTTAVEADLDVKSCSVTSHDGTNETALSKYGVFCHEVGHTLTAFHDNSGHCQNIGLDIQNCACDSGPKLNLMCETNSDCATGCTGGPTPGKSCAINSDCGSGGTCTTVSSNLLCTSAGGVCRRKNQRTCDLISPTRNCVSNSDCCDSNGANCTTCSGPENRVCLGGSNEGTKCNASSSYSWMCTGGGTCTGAPMNWNLYAMGGAGPLGFSPCSRDDIFDYLDTSPTCLHGLVCGDVNKGGGSYCSGGSEPKSACTSNADCAGGGTCVKVCSGGTSPGWPCATNGDCASGGTCTYVNAITSTDALSAQSIACASDYDDLADVYPAGSVDGSVTDCAGTSGDVNYLLGVAVGSNPAPTICGVDDEPWW